MREALTTKVEISELTRQLGASESMQGWLGEGWGDTVDKSDRYFDGIGGIGRIADLDVSSVQQSRPEDRRHGDNWPIWRTEYEHAQIRAVARLLADIDEVAISALDNLVNYSIGNGLAYSVNPKQKDATTDDKRLAAIVTDAMERFLDANKIEREFDREEFRRLHRDGETALGLFAGKGGIPDVRLIDPSFIAEPDNPQAIERYVGERENLNWKYGIATTGDTTKIRHAYVSWYGDDLDYDVIPESQLVCSKRNVDMEVKRGLSDLFAVWRNLQNAGKLLNNTIQGAAIQAAIAYIRKHSAKTRNDQIQDFVAGGASARTVTKMGGGSKTVYEKRNRPGMILDTPNDGDITAGPMGQMRQPVYIEVVQAALRLVGVRFQMPEYMISGDASNGNFASTLVAEAPFTKSSESRQAYTESKRIELVSKAIAMMCRAGVIPVPFREVKRRLKVVVEGPAVAVRDQLEQHTIHKEEYEAGARSMQTWREAADLDDDEEERRGAQPTSVDLPDTTDPVPPPVQPGPSGQADELPGPRGPKDGIDTALQVKGAETQNTARLAYPALALIIGVQKGEVPRDSAMAQLQQIYQFSRDEAEALLGSSGTAPIPSPETVAESWNAYP